jgi:hypothetical protein
VRNSSGKIGDFSAAISHKSGVKGIYLSYEKSGITHNPVQEHHILDHIPK